MIKSAVLATVLLAPALASADCTPKQKVHIEVTYQTQLGESVYVLGPSAEFGSNDMRRAVKLSPANYPVWSAEISVPANTSPTFQYVIRGDGAEYIGDRNNGRVVSGVMKVGNKSQIINRSQSDSRQDFTENEFYRDYDPSNPPYIFSSHLKEKRRYRVVLPPSYDGQNDKRYPVIYAHDGQNIFDMGDFGTWDLVDALNVEWKAGRLREVIVVGIDNTINRMSDYNPDDDGGSASKYIRFIQSELKPLIDRNYRTLTDAPNTGTFGSSMGGLVSMEMGWSHSNVFSKVGVFSASFQNEKFRKRVMSSESPTNLRVYLDSGNAGMSLDNFYLVREVRDSLVGRKQKPFQLEGNLRYVVGDGHSHNEVFWAERVGGALSYLFPACEAR